MVPTSGTRPPKRLPSRASFSMMRQASSPRYMPEISFSKIISPGLTLAASSALPPTGPQTCLCASHGQFYMPDMSSSKMVSPGCCSPRPALCNPGGLVQHYVQALLRLHSTQVALMMHNRFLTTCPGDYP